MPNRSTKEQQNRHHGKQTVYQNRRRPQGKLTLFDQGFTNANPIEIQNENQQGDNHIEATAHTGISK